MEKKITGADMATRFNPQEIENDIYQAWEQAGAFVAHREEGKKPFTIVMPPPNITGQLHMGHAMDCILQDAPIRYHRMKGDPTLWLPGTDHAAIATEVKIVEAMRKEGLTKQSLGREKFLERAWQWKKEYGGRIVNQQRRMGVSCDWSRERFTMDEGCSRAVREVFVRLYEKGLIYRGQRMINWCPACRSALSDAEVEYKEQASHLWHIRYPGADGGEGVVVATTRPETMLGDTGVAVNPADERYRDLVGKKVILPLMNKEIPVVADDYVEMEFGTGAVKMTPAHDPNDFEVAQRHNLEIITVTNDDGTMNENAGAYNGMDPLECRKAVLEELDRLGLLVKTEDYKHNVGFCYRHGNTVVEPVEPQKPEPPKPKPKPEPPKPKPKPKEPEKPKELEKIVTNIVQKVEKKEEKKPEKKEEKKPEEKPKKTAKELREERLKQMRESAKNISKKVTIEVKNAPSGDGRTTRKTLTDAQIRELLNQGYRPGTSEQLATGEMQRCLSLIQMAIKDKWDRLAPKIGNNGTVLLSVQFNSSGGLVNVRLAKSCGDRLSDDAALSVARSVSAIPGLSQEFLSRFRRESLTIRYYVSNR